LLFGEAKLSFLHMEKWRALLCALLLFFITLNLEAHAERPSHWATPIDKNFNLHKMDKNLYRSAMPDKKVVEKLKTLGISTTVNFYQESNKNWLSEANLQEIHLPMRMRSFDDEDAIDALSSIRKAQQKGSVLIHCRHGQNRTGLVAALYRVIYQGWSKEEAMKEMRQGFGNRSMKHGIAYLQNVDIEALKYALDNGECSTSPLAWCHLENWLGSIADTR